jgi:adenosine deaminase/adenosine deaminase CECR1
MKDYWLHMVMFNYCHTKFPDVKYSMHAGELTLGLVQPEDLTSHINDAVYTEPTALGTELIWLMKANHTSCCATWQNKIAIEINLVSNEFILKVKENRHPISLYRAFGFPL